MAGIHTTRHCILHQRTSTRPHSTYRTFTKESQTFTTLLARHQALQIHHRTNNNTQSKHQQHPGSRRSCRCRLGRMPYYQETNFRFQHHLLGTTAAFGRTQATIALSSAESELYAICTGVNEGLHLRNFLLETNICSKLNLRIHTDSTAGKIATRQGTANEQNTSTSSSSTHKTSSSATSLESLRSTHSATAQICLPNASAKKHYTGSSRALGYAFSTTNDQRNSFTTTTTTLDISCM